MATTKEKMIEAQQLIKAERYDDARRILVNIDHPKAIEWLAKIDKVAPVLDDLSDPFEAKPENFFVNIGFAILPFLIAGILTAVMIGIFNNSSFTFNFLTRGIEQETAAIILGGIIFVGTWLVVFGLTRRYRKQMLSSN